MEKDLKKILVVNEGFSSNLGDQAIRQSVLQVIADLGYKADYANYSVPALPSTGEEKGPAITRAGNGVPTIRPGILRRIAGQAKWYFTNRSAIKRILKQGQYDLVIIGGGQLLNSSEKVRFNIFSLALYCWVTLARKISKSRVYLMGVGAVGEFHLTESFFYRKALNLADGTWVRDQYSKDSLQRNFGVTGKLMPDFAFYNSNRQNGVYGKENLAIVGIYSFHEMMVKFAQPGLTRETFYKTWHEVISRYLQEGLQVRLFHTTASDAVETELFRTYLKDKHGLDIPVADTTTLESLCQLYRPVKKIYSARMHALILGMKYNCIVEAFPITQKLVTFENEYIRSGRSTADYSRDIMAAVSEVLAEAAKTRKQESKQ